MTKGAIILIVTLLTGCESLNDAMVRQLFLDRGLSGTFNSRISERYEKRMRTHLDVPKRAAPPFLDQG